ncbi:Hint domain-containing protein [Paracoccus onubensis]|uniref:Hemolysin n=1 Tax=Paracoccus onubensis TaxID=1675788 RepID=A0A418SZN9_9RHOB|nr:Hint domain-containing protein [Paracoccus onubensis]RJE86412.1 hemolysin [Paracoccus onubensis]
MAYMTQLAGAVLALDELDLTIVEIPPTSVLNNFGSSDEISQYNVQDDGDAATLEQGDYLAPVTNGTATPGTYVGTGVIENAGLTLGSMTDNLLGLGVSVSVNPIDVDYFADENGNVYAITDEPLSDDRIMASLQVNLPGSNNLITIEVPVSELTDTLADLDPTGLLGPILGSAADLSQYIMDTAIITSTTDPAGTKLLGDDEHTVVCFVRGSLIETENGPVAVEHLSVGDRIITRDHGIQEIRWIGSTSLSSSVLEGNPSLRPVRIRAGALGENTPSSDLLVSPQHRVLVRSKIAQRMFGTMEVLVAAKQLCQLDGIDIAEVSEVEYFHFLFDQHEVVYSNGAETESLYTGPQALKSVSIAAREEIFSLFPQLRDAETVPSAARELPSGRKARKLAMRHLQHGKPLVS